MKNLKYIFLICSIFMFSACQSNMNLIADKYSYGSGVKFIDFEYGDESFRSKILLFDNEGSAWVIRNRNPFALQVFDDVYMYQNAFENMLNNIEGSSNCRVNPTLTREGTVPMGNALGWEFFFKCDQITEFENVILF